MKEKGRALGEGKPVDEGVEGHGLLRREENVPGIETPVIEFRRSGLVGKKRVLTPGSAQMKEALLVGDPKKPGAEFPVLAQAPDMGQSADKPLLDNVEGRLAVTEEAFRIGKQGKLVSAEKLFPGGRIMTAGGLNKGVEGLGHEGPCRVECFTAAKVHSQS